MATGFDELVEQLLYDVALSGAKGIGSEELSRAVKTFYDKYKPSPSSNSAPQNEEDLLFSCAPPESSTVVDDKFIDEVWDWLEKHPDIQIVTADDQESATSSAASKRSNQRIFTNEDRVWQVIAGHGIDHARVPPKQFELLSVIAAHGPNGVVQSTVRKLTAQDKRSVPKRTDTLAERGYITKEYVIAEGTHTALLKLRKFSTKDPSAAHDTRLAQAFRENKKTADEAVSYDVWFKDIFRLLRENDNVIALEDLNIALGFVGKVQRLKQLRRRVARLSEVGCLRKLRARVGDDSGNASDTWTRCIQFLREPTEQDRWEFIRPSSSKRKGKGKGVAVNEDDDSEDDALEDEDVDDEPAPTSTRIPPQWTPDLPYNNFVYNIVENAGPAGISSMDLNERAMGPFWRRPLDEVMLRLTDHWQTSQPPHLRHLGIIRDTEVKGKLAHFKFRTMGNFEKAVEMGQTEWAAVQGNEGAKNKKKSPRNSGTAALDKWGFPQIDPNLFAGPEGRAGLLECQTVAGREADPNDGEMIVDAVPGELGPKKKSERKAKRAVNASLETSPNESKVVDKIPGELRPRKKQEPKAKRAVNASLQTSPNEGKVLDTNSGEGRPRKETTPQPKLVVNASRGADSNDGEMVVDAVSGELRPRKKPGRKPKLNARREPYTTGGEVLDAVSGEWRPRKKPGPKSKADANRTPNRRQDIGSATVNDVEEYEKSAERLASVLTGAESNSGARKRSAEQAQLPQSGSTSENKVARTARNPSRASVSPQEASDETRPSRAEEIKADLLARSKPGVYINPLGARDMKFMNHAQTGRPGNALIAVIKSDKLKELEWFKVQKARIAPKASRLSTQDVTNEMSDDDDDDGENSDIAEQGSGRSRKRKAREEDEPAVETSQQEKPQTASSTATPPPPKRHLGMPLGDEREARRRSFVELLTSSPTVPTPVHEETPAHTASPNEIMMVTPTPALTFNAFSMAPVNSPSSGLAGGQRSALQSGEPTAPAVAGSSNLNLFAKRKGRPPRWLVEERERIQMEQDRGKSRIVKLPLSSEVLRREAKRLEEKHALAHDTTTQDDGTTSSLIAKFPISPILRDGRFVLDATLSRPNSEDARSPSPTPRRQNLVATLPLPRDLLSDPQRAFRSISDGHPSLVAKLPLPSSSALDHSAQTGNAEDTAIGADVSGTFGSNDVELREDQAGVGKVRRPNLIAKLPISGIEENPEAENPDLSELHNVEIDESPLFKGRTYSKAGTTRHGGVVQLRRSNIILEIVHKAGGAFPGDEDVWFPFVTQWQKLYKQTPDRRTVEHAVNNLVHEQKLKKFEFSFADGKGGQVHRHIISEPGVGPNSAKAKRLQNAIVDAYPHRYLPKSVEIEKILRDKARSIPPKPAQDDTVDTDSDYEDDPKTSSNVVDENGLSYWGSFPDVQGVVVKRTPLGKASLDSQRQQRKGGNRRQRGPVLHPRKRRQTTSTRADREIVYITDETDDGDQSDDDLSEIHCDDQYGLQNNFQVSGYLHHPNSMSKMPRRFRARTSLSPGFCPKAFWMLLNAPEQVFHTTSGTFGTQAQIKRPHKRGKHSRESVSTDIDWEQLKSAPRSTGDLLHRADNLRLPGTRSTDSAFYRYQCEIDRISDVELVLANAGDEFNKSKELNFIIHSLNCPHIRDGEQGFVVRDKDFVDGFLPVVQAEKQRSGRKKPGPKPGSKRSNKTPLRNAPLAQASTGHPTFAPATLFSPFSGAFSPAHLQIGQTQQPQYPSPTAQAFVPHVYETRFKGQRRPNYAKVAGIFDSISATDSDAESASVHHHKKGQHKEWFQEPKRLAIAVALVRMLCGGALDAVNANWDIVAHALGFRYKPTKLRFRWNYQSKGEYGAEFAGKLQSALHEPFLKAYENGELSNIDFENLSVTDWPGLVKWVEKSSLARTSTDFQSLSELRETLRDRSSDATSKNAAGLNSALAVQPTTNCLSKRSPSRYRSDVLPKGDADEDCLVKSWIRAIAATKDQHYNQQLSVLKLQSFSATYLDRMINDMVQANMLARVKGERHLPGRNYRITPSILSQFDRWPGTNTGTSFSRQMATFRNKIIKQVQQHGKFEPDSNQTEAQTTLLMCMVSQGLLSPTPILPVCDNGPDGTASGMNKWGIEGFKSYTRNTRQVEVQDYHFEVMYTTTPKFTSRHGLKAGVQPPMYPSAVLGEPGFRHPFWVDIHGNLIKDIWEMVLQSILHCLVSQSCSTASSIARAHENTLWGWEIELVLKWMEEVGIAVRSSSRKEVEGEWKGGWRVSEWWYCAFLPEIAAW